MTKLLVRLFIKDWDKVTLPRVREQYGVLGGWVAIVCNTLLFALKFVMGLIANSIAVTGDAFNNLSDAGSGIVTLIGFKVSSVPADDDHPFGHGRIEYISGLVVTFFVFLAGFDVVKGAFDKILNPTQVNFHPLILAGLVLSILVKLWLAAFNRKLGGAIDSATLKASAQDSLNDCISTAVTLAGVVLDRFLPFNIDGYLGLIVGGFIFYSGWDLAKSTVGPLLGQRPDPKLVEQIYDIILKNPGVKGVHDLVLHDYGPGRVMGSAHVEVSRTMDVMEAHDMIDNIEKSIQKKLHMPFVVHYDPIADDSEEVNIMREKVKTAVSQVNTNMTIHDFRMVSGNTHTNLIFDVVVPSDEKRKNFVLKSEIDALLNDQNKESYTVITFDRHYL